MGVLEDAIREHLDLKRKHGASDAELNQQEAEALGPTRRDAPEDEVAEAPVVEEAPVDEAPVQTAPVEEAAVEQPEAELPPAEPAPAEPPADPDFGGEAPEDSPRRDLDFD